MNIFEKIVYICGSQNALANKLGITRGAVTSWKKTGIPAERCIQIEKMTGGKITRQEMRPDMFGEF